MVIADGLELSRTCFRKSHVMGRVMRRALVKRLPKEVGDKDRPSQSRYRPAVPCLPAHKKAPLLGGNYIRCYLK